jgi:hypothetical protein
MTSYRGRESGHVVQMGFDLWSWRRSDCVALTDGVLQGMWGLTRSGPSPVASVRASRFIEPTSTPKGAAALTSRRVSTRR